MIRRRSLQIWLSMGVLTALILAAIVFSVHVTMPNRAPQDGVLPGMAGDRRAYAFALFSLFTMTTLSIRKIFVIVQHLRAHPWQYNPEVGIYRIGILLMLVAVVIGAGPDVAILILWGEVSRETFVFLRDVDRICDGLTIIPFLAALMTFIRVDQIAAKRPRRFPEDNIQGALSHTISDIIPSREGLREHARLVLLVMGIALGLAVLK